MIRVRKGRSFDAVGMSVPMPDILMVKCGESCISFSRPQRCRARNASAVERRRDRRTNGVRRAPYRVRVEMGITLGSCSVSVTEKFADDRQAKAGARANTGEGVAQVVNAQAGKGCRLGHCRPGLFEISAGNIGACARDDVRPNSLQ